MNKKLYKIRKNKYLNIYWILILNIFIIFKCNIKYSRYDTSIIVEVVQNFTFVLPKVYFLRFIFTKSQNMIEIFQILCVIQANDHGLRLCYTLILNWIIIRENKVAFAVDQREDSFICFDGVFNGSCSEKFRRVVSSSKNNLLQ